MYSDLVKYIRKQEKALAVVCGKRREIEDATAEAVERYRNSHNVNEYVEWHTTHETKTGETYKSLGDKVKILTLKRNIAVRCIATMICEAIRDELKEGGKLFEVPTHYKKFTTIVDEKIAEAGLDGLRAYLYKSFSTVYLSWRYSDVKDEDFVATKKDGYGYCELKVSYHQRIYRADEIDKVVSDYLREEKACYRMAAELEKRAQAIKGRYDHVEPTGIGKTGNLIYGRKYA